RSLGAVGPDDARRVARCRATWRKQRIRPVLERARVGQRELVAWLGAELALRPHASNGSFRILRPVASKIALPIAGATPTIGVSPAPALARSFRSSSTLSITGVSAKRGTR